MLRKFTVTCVFSYNLEPLTEISTNRAFSKLFYKFDWGLMTNELFYVSVNNIRNMICLLRLKIEIKIIGNSMYSCE